MRRGLYVSPGISQQLAVGKLAGLKKLDAVAERVGSKGPIETGNRFRVVFHFEACSSERVDDLPEIADEKSWMRSLRWPKVGFYAKVQLQRTTPKPCTPSRGEIRRLRDFREPKNLAVKTARQRFTRGRHGELNVIDSVNGHHQLR